LRVKGELKQSNTDTKRCLWVLSKVYHRNLARQTSKKGCNIQILS